MQRLTWLVSGRLVCAWVGSAHDDVQAFTVGFTTSDTEAQLCFKASLLAVLTEAQLAGREVEVVHDTGSSVVQRVATRVDGAMTHPIQLDAIEVTQGIQDLAQSVPLLAGKRTVVRAYLSNHTGAPVTVQATLLVRGGPDEPPFAIAAASHVVLEPGQAGDLTPKRDDVSRSLVFPLPHTTEGPMHLQLHQVTNVVTGQVLAIGNERRPIVSFQPSAPMRVRVLGIRYQQGGTTHVPTPHDFALLRSWLERAYPASAVIATSGVVDATSAVPFTCTQVNAQVTAIRNLDVASGTDARTKYYGFVSDGGFFMRGCAAAIPDFPDPARISSGPTGSRTWGWDTDGSYGDWYGGHELGHTYGRRHPGFCGEPGSDIDNYPFNGGQLANTSGSFAGFDVGDPVQGLARAARPGTQWHDVMTYCSHQWLSPYTYLGIRQRLVAEDALPADTSGASAGALPPAVARAIIAAGGGRPDERDPLAAVERRRADHRAAHSSRTPPDATPSQLADGDEVVPGREPELVLVDVVARANLTRGTGSIEFVTPLERGVPTTEHAENAARLRISDADGAVVDEIAVEVQLDTDLLPSDDRTGLIDALLVVPETSRTIELLIGDQVVDHRTVGGPLPDAGAAQHTDGPGAVEVRAQLPTAAPDHVTYAVQVSTDAGRSWQAVAVGLPTPTTTVDRGQFAPGEPVEIRVLANTGLRRAVVATDAFVA